MTEYIERKAAVMRLMQDGCSAKNVQSIMELPAADVAPVVYGRWGTGRFNLETGNYEEQCTRCRNFSKEYGKPYCPNCGARMDGAE